MNTFCISSSAWLRHKNKTISLIRKIIDQATDHSASISLDLTTVVREKSFDNEHIDEFVKVIDFRNWVNESLSESGIMNIEAIRRHVQSFTEDDLIIIYATGFPSSIIIDAITQIGIGLYSANQWPKTIALICDDTHFFQVSTPLAQAFYIRPSILIDFTISRYIRDLVHNANMTRFFGLKLGLVTRYIQQRINRLHLKLERKLAKNRGWLWEE